MGITAYTLGMRHAVDADHIGAIDNMTRKLMTDGQRPLGVGFFVSPFLLDRESSPCRQGLESGRDDDVARSCQLLTAPEPA